MFLLALETTCDETAAAVIDPQLQVLGAVVASQEPLHQQFGGVVPELASRAHMQRILPVIDQVLHKANIKPQQLHAVAVAVTPGLAGSLVVGLAAAKALAVALDIPLVGINHLHAHVYACRMAARREVFPCVGYIVSGGHTCLYHCPSATEFELLGATIDDAAGEAFDKVASMLGLSFPGGPAIQRAAEGGNPRAYRFPRPMLGQGLDFSFSGLKTAVRYAIGDPGQGIDQIAQAARRLTPQQVADLAASFQQAVVDVLVQKALAALEHTGLNRLCVGGGVAANRLFREQLEQALAPRGVELVVAPLALCTDNAVMGAIAWEYLRAGKTSPRDIDVSPGLLRRKESGRTNLPA